MLNPKDRVDIEQGIAQAAETWPRLWKQLFDNCIDQGFENKQALQLVMAYIIGQNPNGTKPNAE